MSYGIIASGGAYKINTSLLQNIQIKMINKPLFPEDNPLDIKQTFKVESLMYRYNKLKNMYLLKESATKIRNLNLPKMKKAISE